MSKFYSTADPAHVVSACEAVLRGLAPNQGLYMPCSIPRLSDRVLRQLPRLSFAELASEAIKPWFEGELEESTIQDICSSAFTFDAPLAGLQPGLSVLELFHGPTFAFKDFGARFLARLTAKIAREPFVVLVATSGDTGSAVASAFFGLEAARVVLLYPKGGVSLLQEKQLTTMGGNIHALEVSGTFDDCQRFVKTSFADREIQNRLRLSSANSINVARLLPQALYYLRAWAQFKNPECEIVFSVPSGNFGNLTSGLIAKRMGLDSARFIAATNINDIVPRYLESGVFEPRASKKTLSNAMDVGNPSNFARLDALFASNLARARAEITGERVTDEQTAAAMRRCFEQYGYVLDPHGAVAFEALGRHCAAGIVLATAHPAKFMDVVEPIAGGNVSMPKALAECLAKEKRTVEVRTYDELRDFLLALPQPSI